MLLLLPLAWADTDEVCTECVFGAANVNAVAGAGRLTAGIAADGDLSVLSWPSPGQWDQLQYVASNAADARSKPHMGALDGMGSYLGLALESNEGLAVTWLREWESEQTYAADDAAVPVTTFRNAPLGLTVTLTDAIAPDVDVLLRHVAVERDPDSPVLSASLVVYENLSLSRNTIPQLPIGDWLLDHHNDWLALWDGDAIVHLLPGDQPVFDEVLDLAFGAGEPDWSIAEAALAGEQSAADLASALEQAWTDGVVARVSTVPAPAAFQVGADATPFCAFLDSQIDNVVSVAEADPAAEVPIDPTAAQLLRCEDDVDALYLDPGWTQPMDALTDLADGALSGSTIAAGQTNGALLTPLSFDGDRAEAAVYFAFGESPGDASAALDDAQTLGAAALIDAATEAFVEELAHARMPDPALGPDITRIATRALVNILVAQDAHTGAIVASIARQSPYFLDWPRDGAFFDVALDVAGLTDRVSRRNLWYTELQRTEAVEADPLLGQVAPVDPDSGETLYPAGAWEMNYYPDGTVGGPIRFEIDNTALHTWALLQHAARLEGGAREEYLDVVWPSTLGALDLLERWEDPDTHLPAPANEDDHLALTSTLHGAVAVHLALATGAEAAAWRGDEERAARYQQRADELQAAIQHCYFDEATGRWRVEAGGEPQPVEGSTAYNVTGWLVWPGLVASDEQKQIQLAADLAEVRAALAAERGFGLYFGKVIVAGGRWGEGEVRVATEDALAELGALAVPGADHFGEVLVRGTDEAGVVGMHNRIATPHVWEGALFYLSAMALTDPEALDVHLDDGEGVCDCCCGAAGGRESGVAGFAFVVIAVIRRGRGRFLA